MSQGAIGLEPGQLAPDFELRESGGQSTRLADFRGQTVLLAFFPSEWDPARPQLLAAYNAVLGRIPGDHRLVAVSREGFFFTFEEKAGAVRFPLLTALSSEGDVAETYGVQGKQAAFVIGPDGVIRWSHVASVGVYPSTAEIERALAASVPSRSGVSRREFLVTAVAASLALSVMPRLSHGAVQENTEIVSARHVSLHINGRAYGLQVDSRTSLLDVLREQLNLTGTKKGCDHGQCGACTVHLNGRRVNSCLILAMQAEGSRVTTVEGVADGDSLHPVQAAFMDHDGFQCGYCTSGQIMSALACIKEGHTHTDAEIAEWMSGNICRCGAYTGIREAIRDAAGRRK